MTPRQDELRRSLLAEARISGIRPLGMAMAVVVVLAAALVAMLLWENANTRARALADARLAVYHESRILGESAARTLEMAGFALAHLGQDVAPILADPSLDRETAGRLLAESRPWFPPLAALSVHDPAGRRVAAAGLAGDLDDVSGLPFFRDHRSGALPFIVGTDEPRAGLRISRRLATPNGRFLGVVSAVLDPSAFDIARDFDVTRRVDGAAVVLPSGTVLAAWPTTIAARTAEAADLRRQPLYAGLPASALEATGIEIVDTDATVIAVTPVRNGPFLVAAAVSKGRVLARWRSQTWQVFAAAIAIVAVIGLVGVGLSHYQARRRAEIERTLRVLSHALEDSPVMVLITSPAGRIEYVNRKLENVSGYRRDELVGRMPQMFASEDLPPETREAIGRAILDGQEWSGLVTSRRKNGEPYRASLSLSPIRDAKGRVANLVGVAEDVTDRIENERHQRQIEKAEALGSLAGGVAHEFNNMLMPIVSLTTEIIKSMPAESPSRRMMDIVLKAALKARDLVRRILVFSSDNPDQWRVHDVSGLLEESLAVASVMVPPGIELRTSIPAGLGRVHADAPQINAAVVNLVSNAIHAMKAAGTERVLSIALERAEPGERAAGVPPGLSLVPHAVIRVADTGCGIAPEVRKRIFDPFFTTREVGEGTGLGLSIIHGIAMAHGGAVTVDSTVGAGTTVSLFLPLSEADARDAAAETPPARERQAAAG